MTTIEKQRRSADRKTDAITKLPNALRTKYAASVCDSGAGEEDRDAVAGRAVVVDIL